MPEPRYSPKGHHDLDGWSEITCFQAELVRRSDLMVASSFTDMEKPDVFAEWWMTTGTHRVRYDVPVLREYRDASGCRHYLAMSPGAALLEDEPEADQ